jgi:hypothetical protein
MRFGVVTTLSLVVLAGCSMHHPVDELVAGYWEYPGPFGVVEIRREQGGFRMYQVSDDSKSKKPGELMAEFTYDKEAKRYSGRHVWGGSKIGQMHWGREGGLTIELVDDNHIFMVYVDSKYTGGWTFTRAAQRGY